MPEAGMRDFTALKEQEILLGVVPSCCFTYFFDYQSLRHEPSRSGVTTVKIESPSPFLRQDVGHQ